MEKVNQKVLPYNTGKVQIGLLYEPPLDYRIDSDASIVQKAILEGNKESEWSHASNVTTVTIVIAIACLWVIVLFAGSVRW